MLSTRSPIIAAFAGLLLGTAAIASAEEVAGKETGRNTVQTFNAKTNGFVGMCLLEIDGKPAACFGLDKQERGKTRYTYLLLLKSGPKSDEGSGAGGESNSSIGSDGNRDVRLKLQASPAGREIDFDYRLKAEAGKASEDTLTIGGKDYGPDDPRVFLVDLTAEKITAQPLKIASPSAVPDLAEEDKWAAQILKAIAEVKEKSPEAKAFFDGNK